MMHCSPRRLLHCLPPPPASRKAPVHPCCGRWALAKGLFCRRHVLEEAIPAARSNSGLITTQKGAQLAGHQTRSDQTRSDQKPSCPSLGRHVARVARRGSEGGTPVGAHPPRVFLRTHHKDIRGLLDLRGAEPFVQRPLHTRHEFITGPVGRAVHSRFGLQCGRRRDATGHAHAGFEACMPSASGRIVRRTG